MLRLLDPMQEHEYKPNDADLTFYVLPMTHRQVVGMSAGASATPDGGFIVTYDNILKTNIRRIENVEWVEGKPTTLETPKEIARFVDACGTPEGINILQQVFKFIQSLSIPTEDEAGN